ncbi:MAG TPA: glycosyltransferase [Dehalococcoidia bacterium]|nr:glycosyltransferase [Dehalococcoidia bacterium]
MRPLRIFTWPVHGAYLQYLTALSPHEFYLPVRPRRDGAYGGRGPTLALGDNVIEVAEDDVRRVDVDCVLFQSAEHYLHDQYAILSEEQRRLPKIFLEHDPPRQHPTDTPHPVTDGNTLVVHVTRFNALMWETRAPVRVIEHGVPDRGPLYTGEVARGIAAINNLRARGRRLGLDVFLDVRECVPVDLVGMGSEEVGGVGEVPPALLPEFESRYRFFFYPVRYTSLGLALCEAMMAAMPPVALRTTEVADVIDHGVTGFAALDAPKLVEAACALLRDAGLAREIGARAREMARERSGLERFTRDWNDAFALVAGAKAAAPRPAAAAAGGGR